MDNVREEFEKLSGIAEILNKNGGGYHKEHTNDYHHCNLYFDKFLNGAWYAFQEQQKKLDCCREENKAHLEKIDELQARVDISEKLRDSQFEKLWSLTQAIEKASNGADEDFDLFLNYLSNILKGNKDEN